MTGSMVDLFCTLKKTPVDTSLKKKRETIRTIYADSKCP